MRLVTKEEMGILESRTINEYGISGIILMENAGIRVVEVIVDILGKMVGKRVAVFAGKGNNGGDGFVVARHLHNRGADVQVFLAAEQESIKGDALINLNICKKMGQKIYQINKKYDSNQIRLALMNSDLVVDALYGTGFRGTVNEQMAQVFEVINTAGKPVVAVDIPSGLEADTGRVNGSCLCADHTVTFALPKLGLVLYSAREYVGKLHVKDISIPATVTSCCKSNRYYITEQLVKNWWPQRTGIEHKGTFGRVLIIAGSRGMSGAAVLAAMAAARSGAGLVTLGVPIGIHDIAEAKLTEVMTFPLPETNQGTLSLLALQEILDRAQNSDVIALGPGLGVNTETAALVKELLLQVEIPCVLDADGLNVMAGKDELFSLTKSDLVLTPHPGEMARLTGQNIDQIQNNRLKIAYQKAMDWQSVVVLKGADTVVTVPDGTLYINGTGNPGMASGGTGDVLTGIIAGLIAQGIEVSHAAAAGVFLHGLAGNAAAKCKSMAGMLAGDILEQLPLVLKGFEKTI